MKKQLLILLLFIGSVCSAQDWQYLMEANNNVYYYKLNSGSTAWVKVVSDNSFSASVDDENPTTVEGYKVYLYKFSCTSKKLGVLKTIVYSKDGKPLDTRTTDEFLADMEVVKPNSVGEEMLFQFCYAR